MADMKEESLEEGNFDDSDTSLGDGKSFDGQSADTIEARESFDQAWSVPSPQMSNQGLKRLDFETDGTQDDCLEENLEEGLEPPSKRPRLVSTHELEIIDEIEGDEDGEDYELNDDSDMSEEEVLSDEEIDKWLDEDLQKKMAETGGKQDGDDMGCPVEKEKVVLKERGNDPFDILPEGWVVVTHNSGMPVYLQKEHRVCSLARPYFLGPGSVRKHDIPLSAIPCLQYTRELMREGKARGSVCKCCGHDNSDSSGPGEGMSNDGLISETQEPPSSPQKHQCPYSPGSNSHIPKPMPSVSKSSGSLEKDDCAVGSNGVDPVGDDVSVMSADSNAASSSRASEPLVNGVGSSESSATEAKAEDAEANGASDAASADAGGDDQTPQVKIESAEERKKENSLDPLEVRSYCERLFEFKTITVRKYKIVWKDMARQEATHDDDEETVPSRIAIQHQADHLSPAQLGQTREYKLNKRKEFVLNPSGKSSVCILHEYVQHTMRVQPKYIFKELENAQTPYSATVVINDVEYGTGYASSKKSAKLEAAKVTLQILIPEMNKVTDEQMKDSVEDLSFFDVIKIEDPRIYELGNKAGQPSPYQILGECLKRNHGLGDTHCHMDMKQLKHQKSEFTMTVGKHSATVIAKNKRDGKQRAAQAIMQLLHPHITCWGSLLRLYGNSSMKKLNEKKDDMNINELQSRVKSSRPNNAILERLWKDMIEIRTKKNAITSKGKLRVGINDLPRKISNLDL